MTEIQTLWWMLQYVILPAIGASYVLILGMGRWMSRMCTRGRRDLWKAIADLKANELKHIEEEIQELKDRLP